MSKYFTDEDVDKCRVFKDNDKELSEYVQFIKDANDIFIKKNNKNICQGYLMSMSELTRILMTQIIVQQITISRLEIEVATMTGKLEKLKRIVESLNADPNGGSHAGE